MALRLIQKNYLKALVIENKRIKLFLLRARPKRFAPSRLSLKFFAKFLVLGQALSVILVFSGCKTPGNEIGTLLNQRMDLYFSKSAKIDIFYATNRKTDNQSEKNCSNEYFKTDFSDSLTIGSCRINVPASHEIGSIKLTNEKDNSYQFLTNDFFSEDKLLTEVKETPFAEVIIFVHGFNVPFEDAILRAAQLKYDLKFPGKIIVFSWPAGSDPDSLLGKFLLNMTYKNNFANAAKSRIPFSRFLLKLKATRKKIHLIVHSMGHQVVLPALADMNESSVIEELILNAPDFSIQDFTKIKSSIKKTAKRITLYCSPGDNALIASESMNESDRLGSCKANFNDIDVINVNQIDNPLMGIGGLGHGYYSSRPILTDVFQVLLGVDANKRLFIRKADTRNKEDYILRN